MQGSSQCCTAASEQASQALTLWCGTMIHTKGSIITVKIRLDFQMRKEHSSPFLAMGKHSWFMINMRVLVIWQIYCISCRISWETFFSSCIFAWNPIYAQPGEPEGIVGATPDGWELHTRHARGQTICCPPVGRPLCAQVEKQRSIGICLQLKNDLTEWAPALFRG